MSSLYRSYNTVIPMFLHSHPREFIQQVCKRWQSAKDYAPGNLMVVDSQTFVVRSEDSDNSYRVFFGDDTRGEMPTCQCSDWQRSHWPCKHFCAIFQHSETHSWENMTEKYRESPFITIDPMVKANLACTTDPETCRSLAALFDEQENLKLSEQNEISGVRTGSPGLVQSVNC